MMSWGVKKTTTGTLVSELERPAERRTGLDSVEAARYEAVVRRSSERLIQMLDVVFLDRELAADAAQDAYVQLYLHWSEVGGSAEPEAWLYRVAVNRCKDYRRRLARGAKLLRRLVAEAPAGNTTGGWEPADDFRVMLRGLPTRQRVAAALFYQADMSIYEISRTMGISEGAVNSHLNRARRTLKEALEARR
ncbi:MAG: sigma-70 family RNA polymerase sigma factor [Thermoleophilia bacterium]|nr:sigma-70 family RNA polymerase sigma factor [Thermoleophilia bacterium]